MERFGDRVRKVRVQQEKTIAELAKHLGYTAVHVSDIERGNRNPPSDQKIQRWSEFLGVDAEELLKLAANDVDSVKVEVNHDPRKAELTFAFARRLDGLSEDESARLLEFLRQGESDE